MPAAIRLARPADGPALAGIYRPAVLESAISFELDAPDAHEMAERVERVMKRTPWLVYERDGVVAGYAYAGPFRERAAYRWSCEVSAYVAAEARRLGVARALYTSLCAALEVQGYRRAFAGITLPNEASVGFHTALGFTPAGIYHAAGFKMGAWHDVGWYERALAPLDPAPEPPVALPVCVGQAAFQSALIAGLERG